MTPFTPWQWHKGFTFAQVWLEVLYYPLMVTGPLIFHSHTAHEASQDPVKVFR
jgi:hypothetical protein